MDPITLSLALAAVGLVFAAIVISLQRLVDWFRSRGQIKQKNANAVAFSLAERINGRQYAEIGGVFGNTSAPTRIVQGFYDRETEEIIDARAVSSTQEVKDQDVIRAHDDSGGLVLYT